MPDDGTRRPPRFVPRAWAASLEAESREWLVRCSVCGYERSARESGGVRWKASGTSKQYRRCPHCGTPNWHTIYRPRDGASPPLTGTALPDGTIVPPPGARPRRPTWQYVVPSVLGVVLIIALFVGGLLVSLSRAPAGPRDATDAYFGAVIAQDWAGARAALSASRRGVDTPASLATDWAMRAGAHGPATSFRITGVSVKTATARVSGTLSYRDGTTESVTAQLVTENGGWKIADGP